MVQTNLSFYTKKALYHSLETINSVVFYYIGAKTLSSFYDFKTSPTEMAISATAFHKLLYLNHQVFEKIDSRFNVKTVTFSDIRNGKVAQVFTKGALVSAKLSLNLLITTVALQKLLNYNQDDFSSAIKVTSGSALIPILIGAYIITPIFISSALAQLFAEKVSTTQVSTLTPTSSSIELLDDQNFEEKTRLGFTLVDFYADWCGPCKRLTPMLQEFSKKLANKVKIAKIDVDKTQALSERFNINAMPTLILLKNGKEIDRYVGLPKEENLYQLLLSGLSA